MVFLNHAFVLRSLPGASAIKKIYTLLLFAIFLFNLNVGT